MGEDMHYIKVLNVYRHHIIYKNIKNKFKKQFTFCVVVLSLLVLGAFGVGFGVQNMNLFKEVNFTNNAPINPLYSDIGDIIFTSSGNVIFKNNKTLKMITPIISAHNKIENGVIIFTVKESIMVLSPENAVVAGVGVLPDGKKYIELKHSNTITSRIENIDIAGVIINQLVKKGKEIATAKMGGNVCFTVYENGQIIPNLKINKNEISWENLQ